MEFEKILEQFNLKSIEYMIYKNNKVFEMKFFDISKEKKLAADSYLRIASISKFVFTLGFLKLVIKGVLKLNDSVNNYLDFKIVNPHFKDDEIKIINLLNHSASLTDENTYYLDGKYEIKELFVENGVFYNGGKSYLNKRVGTYFQYCNLNYQILAMIVEKVTNLSFNQYLKNELFSKLDLNCSFEPFDLIESKKEVYPLTRYKKDKFENQVDFNIVEKRNYVNCYNPSVYSPQGGLRISLKELAIIMEMVLNKGVYKNKQVVDSKIIDMMTSTTFKLNKEKDNMETNQGIFTEFGMSCVILTENQVFKNGSDHKLYGHLADAYGLLGTFLFDKVHKKGFIVILTGIDLKNNYDLDEENGFARAENEIFNNLKEKLNFC